MLTISLPIVVQAYYRMTNEYIKLSNSQCQRLNGSILFPIYFDPSLFSRKSRLTPNAVSTHT